MVRVLTTVGEAVELAAQSGSVEPSSSQSARNSSGFILGDPSPWTAHTRQSRRCPIHRKALVPAVDADPDASFTASAGATPAAYASRRAVRGDLTGGEGNASLMGVWWHFRQWVYAHPPVAAAGAVAMLLLVGFGGWASTQFSGHDATQAAETALFRVTVAKTVHVTGENGRVVNHVVRRTRTLAGVTVEGKAKRVVIAKHVADVQTKTVVKIHTVKQLIGSAQTITRTLTQQVPAENKTGPPPGKGRPTVTVTVTVTRTQTVTQPAVTVTVTTNKGP
jgi:hypothetical protein